MIRKGRSTIEFSPPRAGCPRHGSPWLGLPVVSACTVTRLTLTLFVLTLLALAPTVIAPVAAMAEEVATDPVPIDSSDAESRDAESRTESRDADPREGEPAEVEESLTSKLTVHGFASVGWGVTDGNHIQGLNEEGTGDLRAAALQLRFAPTLKDGFVAQLEHERNGDSPIMAFRDDVELDWLFYQRRLGERTSLRVGKVPIPIGIYNEIQDVGTILPFYRPPEDVYGELAFASEAVEGLLISHEFRSDSRWRVTLDGYVGEWEFVQITPSEERKGRLEEALGTQLWLYTPVRNLRLGIAAQSGKISDGPVVELGEDESLATYQASVDYAVGPLTVRSEAWLADFEEATYLGSYLEVGGRITSKWSLHGLIQRGRLELTGDLPLEFDLNRDYALGLRYVFNPSFVLKGEIHWNRGFRSQESSAFPFPLRSTRYGIVSFATSF